MLTNGEVSPGDAVVLVRIESLRSADSPRIDGGNEAHVRVLAETESPLPPILVHQGTMRVIDGAHRVKAATLRGASHIEATFFDGTESAAFVLAVQANVTHGLPLSLADRKAAAVRIMSSHPQWSDRTVAASTGLGRRMVGELRERATGTASQLHSRIGLDGRVRPLSSVEGRHRAGELVRQHPNASLREIARVTGISVGTARDVRARIQRGDNPVPARFQPNAPTPIPTRRPVGIPAQRHRQTDGAPGVKDYSAVWQGLARDPSLRLAESGRRLLRWLGTHAVQPGEHSEFVATVPSHCTEIVAELARHYARMWDGFAEELERRGTVHNGSSWRNEDQHDH